jgi:hypothetical protein
MVREGKMANYDAWQGSMSGRFSSESWNLGFSPPVFLGINADAILMLWFGRLGRTQGAPLRQEGIKLGNIKAQSNS